MRSGGTDEPGAFCRSDVPAAVRVGVVVTRPGRGRLVGRRIGVGLVVLVALVVGFATVQYVRLSTGITRSHIFSSSGAGAGAAGLAGRSPHGDVNVLVIGLTAAWMRTAGRCRLIRMRRCTPGTPVAVGRTPTS